MRRFLWSAAFCLAPALIWFMPPIEAQAEVTQCVEITTLPATITVPGVYCLKQNLGTSITTGAAVTINANNVTFEMNGYRLGGATAGLSTTTDGVYVLNRKNIKIRNGSIRGFYRGISILGLSTTSSGHIVEDMSLDGNGFNGIRMDGNDMIVQNNKVTNTGPGDVEITAHGIWVTNTKSALVKGNFVANVDETFVAYGILVSLADNVEVRQNSVFEINGEQSNGITASGSSGVILKDNVASNNNGGTKGIGENSVSDDIACIENTSRGYTTNFPGCDLVHQNKGL